MPAAVTVVLPTRNRPRELRRAVRSVLAQTCAEWELLVVDDGSAPAVAVDPLAVGDPRVTVLRRDGVGVARARNAGIEQASAPWIAFLDDDDLWAPWKLERQLDAARRTGATMLYTSATHVTADGRWIYDRIVRSHDDLPGALLGANVIGEPSTVMVRRDVMASAGGFDPAFSMLADWELWFRLAAIVRPCAMAEITTAILRHPGNMQLVDRATARDELTRLAERHRDVADARRRVFGSAEIELWLADRRRSGERSLTAVASHARHKLAVHGIGGATARAATRVRHAVRPRSAAPWVLQLLGDDR